MLKVRFTTRTWLQVDFIDYLEGQESNSLSLAVLGSVASSHIIDVLHCMHGKRLGSSGESIRIFADGSLMNSMQQLRAKLRQRRPDAWMLRHLGIWSQSVEMRLNGGVIPELTLEDSLRRLRQIRV